MSRRQNKTPPISQQVCTKMVKKCSVNTSPIMALMISFFTSFLLLQHNFNIKGNQIFFDGIIF